MPNRPRYSLEIMSRFIFFSNKPVCLEHLRRNKQKFEKTINIFLKLDCIHSGFSGYFWGGGAGVRSQGLMLAERALLLS